jgi:YesN/AraC family two-component response regulator
MGGLGTIQELLKINPRVKAIVTSGYDQDPIMQHAEQYGFKAALIKPFQISELKEALAKLFQSVDFRDKV